MKRQIRILVLLGFLLPACLQAQSSSIRVCKAATGTTYFQEDAELGETAWRTKWDGDGQGSVWYDAASPVFNWRADTENPHSGSYSLRGHYTLCQISSPTTAPSLSQTPGGSMGARTYYVKTVRVRPNYHTGWSSYIYTAEASFAVSANNLLVVPSPPTGESFYFYNVYAGTTTGDANLKLQNSTPVAVGTNWTEPTSGLTDLGAYPGSFVGCPGGSWTRANSREWDTAPYANGLDHFYFRGWVYIKTPETGGNKDIDRKLIYIRPNPDTWHSTLSVTYSATLDKVRLDVARNSIACAGSSTVPIPAADSRAFNFDTWTALEWEVKLNTPGASNGEFRLWMNGSLVGEVTGEYIRGTCSTGTQSIEVGNQTNDTHGYVADELRYWDDIVIRDTGPIGP